MRGFFSFAFACVFVAISSFACAQQLDLAVGGSTLWSPKNTTASVGFLPPPLKGGVYPGASFEYIKDNHFGFGAEGWFRYHNAVYNDFQTYRPILYNANGIYTTRLAPKTRGDFTAGVGGLTLRFNSPMFDCGIPTGGCRTYLNSTHFMTHAGVGVRYTFWRNFFVRPEASWNYVFNNFQFHSNNVFRVGVSVGHTFGTPENPPPAAKTPPAQTNPPAEQKEEQK